MFKDFIVRKMLEKKLQGIPKNEQEKILNLVHQNPEFFNKIAAEVKTKTDSGMDAKAATMEVMKKHQTDFQGIYNK